MFSFIRKWRRNRVRQQPFPEEWTKVLDKNVPLYQSLPGDLQSELRELILVFLNEKRFEGCGGLELTDEIRITIAAQACLLLMNRDTDFYPTLKTILVYPSRYAARSKRDNGGQEDASVRLGESWQYGPVVLAWDSSRHGALNPNDGHNVVLHEFAHQLDQIDGSADGAPSLGRGLSIREKLALYEVWASVLEKEYRMLKRKAGKGRKTVIDHYGATHPAEFFATATEAFFEKPRQLQKKHGDLYNELKGFYQLDPVEWGSKSVGQ